MACVERETREETGLVVRGVKIVAVTNDKFTEANKHYVTMFAKCERVDKQQLPEVRGLLETPLYGRLLIMFNGSD